MICFLLILSAFSTSVMAKDGHCAAKNMADGNKVAKCEKYDKQSKKCKKKRDCKWINYNKAITACNAKKKEDTDLCEEHDDSKDSCNYNDDKCKWYDLGKPSFKCFPNTKNGKVAVTPESFKFCEKFNHSEEDCLDDTDKKCFWQIHIPTIQTTNLVK